MHDETKASRISPYAFTLFFARMFTRGNLAGIVHQDSIGFCTSKACNEWVDAINIANTMGTVDYKIDTFRVIQTGVIR